jgi:hypothetical protein
VNESKFGACPNQVHFRLSQLADFLQWMQPLLPGSSDQQKQLLLQMLVVQIHTYFEAYYACVVSVATFWDPKRTREYILGGQLKTGQSWTGQNRPPRA